MTRLFSIVTLFSLLILASLMLYHTSDRVNGLERQLRALNAQIEDEQDSMHILKAEWVYLANPARIEAEAQRHLGLQPTAPRRVASLRDMGDLLPLHSGVEPVVHEQIADAEPVVQRTTPARTAPQTHHDRVIAALNAGRVNDRMNIQHTTAAEASTDKIGALIGSLGLHP